MNIRFLAGIFCMVSFLSCAMAAPNSPSSKSLQAEEKIIGTILITANGTTLTGELFDNSSSRALIEKLRGGDIVLDMRDYGDFEKVGDLGFSLPRNDTYFTTEPGDLVLYLGRRFVIYYDTNSWDFTHLGKIRNVNTRQLIEIFGLTDVRVTLHLESGTN